MKKWIAVGLVVAALVGCASLFGPPAIHLDRADIAQRAFVDREKADLRKVFGQFEGLAIALVNEPALLSPTSRPATSTRRQATR